MAEDSGADEDFGDAESGGRKDGEAPVFKASGQARAAVDGSREKASSERLSAAEQKQQERLRRRRLDALVEAFDLPAKDATATMRLIDQLLPRTDRMSTADDVAERLEHGIQDLRERHPKLLMSQRRGRPLDAQTERSFEPIGAFAELMDSEEGLLRAIVVNDRVRAGLERWVTEHQAVRALLLEQLVVRSALVEKWRHLLPKSALPLFSMLFEAGVLRNHLRPSTKLFASIMDAVIEYCQEHLAEAPSRDELTAAARRTEEEFLHVLKEDSPHAERFEDNQERLRAALEEAREEHEKLLDLDGGGDSDQLAHAEQRVRDLELAAALGGGIELHGGLIFNSVEGFAKRLRAAAKMHLSEVDPGSTDQRLHDAASTGEGAGAGQQNHDAVTAESDQGTEIRSAKGAAGDVSKQADVAAPSTGSLDKAEPPLASRSETEMSTNLGDSGTPGDGTFEAGSGGSERGAASEAALVELPPAPVGADYEVFSPERLEKWPKNMSEVRELRPDLPRSTGLSRSTSDRPFENWTPVASEKPFCFMGFRRHADLSAREGMEGPIEPVDLTRLELGEGQWRCLLKPEFSLVLGRGHKLMLPPHSSLVWYGRKLGWSEPEASSLSSFGSPARPDSITANGDPERLIDAFRGVARLRLAELADAEPEHFLADAQAGADRQVEAAEDLARWWLFVLLARHRQAAFDRLYPSGFFHGVHAPDFEVGENGVVSFGTSDFASRVGIWSMEIRRRIKASGATAAAVLGMGQPYSGPRRLAP